MMMSVKNATIAATANTITYSIVPFSFHTKPGLALSDRLGAIWLWLSENCGAAWSPNRFALAAQETHSVSQQLRSAYLPHAAK